MPRRNAPYRLEFRQQMIELVHADRTPEELSREFEPSAQPSATESFRPTAMKAVAWMA